MKIHRPISVIILAAVASLALTGSALAAGNGAYTSNDSRCQTGPFGTVCSTEHSVFKITDAGASGNQNVVSNYRFESTFTGLNGCTSTSTNSTNNHQLVAPDELGQLHYTITYGSSFTCNGETLRCTTQIDYTASGGEVRVDRTRTACTDPL